MLFISNYVIQNSPSRFYRLEPIGIGTADVESLTSYIKRLSELHMVTVGNLIKKEIIPSMNKDRFTVQELIICRNSIDNTSSDLSREMIRVLEQKTCNTGLSLLTMSAYQDYIHSVKGYRKNLAWCPICYEEGLKSGKVYEKLIWHFKDIAFCKEHQINLVDRCPYCGSQIRVLNFTSRIGYCDNCHAWLGENIKSSIADVEISNRHYWSYNNIAELLDNLKSINDDSRKQFSRNIINIMKINNLTQSDLSRICNVPLTTLRDHIYMYQCRLPSLPIILKLSYATRYSLWELLTEEIIDSKIKFNKKHKRSKDSFKINTKKIKGLLDKSIATTGEISPTRFCKDNKIHMETLKKYFPEELSVLKENYKKYTQAKTIERCNIIKNTMRILFEQGIYPGKNAVSRELGKNILQDRQVWLEMLEELGCDVKKPRANDI